MAMGRNAELQEILDDVLSDDGLFLIKSYVMDGYNIQDICDALGVQYATFKKWRDRYPQIVDAMKQGKELTDYKVENALLKSALGYKTKEVKTTTIMKFGKVVETQKEVLEKEQPPNVQAITLWLTNRNKDKWKTPNSKNLLDEVEEDTSIEIKVTRAGKNEADGDVVNESVEVTKKQNVDADGEATDNASDWEDDYTNDAEWAEILQEIE